MKDRTRQTKVRRILALQAECKGKYAQSDKLFADLLAATKVGEPIRTRKGTFQIVDNFANGNAAYKPARICRFELKPVPGKKKKRK